MRNQRNERTILRVILILGVLFCGVLLSLFYSGDVGIMVVLLSIIIVLFYAIVLHISQSLDEPSLLCDSRFYVFSAILAYSVLPPIYGILTLQVNNGVRVRGAYYALTYTEHELLLTVIMSLLFFLGILGGISLRTKNVQIGLSHISESELVESSSVLHRKFIGWFIVCIVSTFIFLLPFFRGGFRIILAGGTISDVESVHESSFLWKIIDIFFSSEMMTVATVAVLFYGNKLSISMKKKRMLLLSVVIVEVLLAYFTTRRARAIAIIICAFVIYLDWYIKRRKKLPIGRIVVTGVSIVFLYFLEAIMGLAYAGNTFVDYLRLFDGIPAYDSLLLSTRTQPSISMLTNIVYGVFRHIPLVGKYLVRLLGIADDAAPLYKWMANNYAVYQTGGGLAYTPQLEAYLCLGFFGCFAFGFIYGVIFGKKRKGLSNILLMAMAFSIARGNLQIVLNLLWPFGIIGFYFYDRFLFQNFEWGNHYVQKDNEKLNK